jgi:hypothetical protein
MHSLPASLLSFPPADFCGWACMYMHRYVQAILYSQHKGAMHFPHCPSYICVYVYVYVCATHKKYMFTQAHGCVCMYPHTRFENLRVCVCVDVHVHMYMYVYMHTYTQR